MLLTLLALVLLLHRRGLLTHPHPLLRPETSNQANLTDFQDWLTYKPYIQNPNPRPWSTWAHQILLGPPASHFTSNGVMRVGLTA